MKIIIKVMFFHNILIVWNNTQQKWKWSNTICYDIDESQNNDSKWKVLIFIRYGVHKIIENEFKSIVTLNRFLGAWDRVETEKDEIEVAQRGLRQLCWNLGCVNGVMDACRIKNFQFSIFEMYVNKVVKIKIWLQKPHWYAHIFSSLNKFHSFYLS